MSYQTTPEPEEPIQQRSLLEAIEGDNDDDVDKYSFENGQLTINAILTQGTHRPRMPSKVNNRSEWKAFMEKTQSHAPPEERLEEDDDEEESIGRVDKKVKIGTVDKKVKKATEERAKKKKKNNNKNKENSNTKKAASPMDMDRTKGVEKQTRRKDNDMMFKRAIKTESRDDISQFNTDTVPETVQEENAAMDTTMDLEQQLQYGQERERTEYVPSDIEMPREDMMVMADMSIDALGEVRLNDPIHSSTPKRKAVEGVFDMEDEEPRERRDDDIDVMNLPIHAMVGEEPKKKKKITRRPKKRRIADGSDDDEERTARGIESDIHDMIVAKMFNNIRAETEHISALITEQRSVTTNRYTGMLQQQHNDMVEDAAEEMRKVTEIHDRPGMAAKKKQDVRAAQLAQEYVERIEKCINSVTETPIAVHVDDIVWNTDLHKTNNVTVRALMKNILSGRKNLLQLVVRGFNHMSEEHGRIMTFIHQGHEIVLAYRELAKIVVDTHKDQYETLEETQHPRLRLSDKNLQRPHVTVDSTSSQPAVGTPHEVPAHQVSHSQVPSVTKKLKNPFAYVLVQVLDNNMVDIEDSKISLVKTMQKDDALNKDMTNRVKMIYMRDIVKTKKLDLNDHSQKYINDSLSAYMSYYNKTLARSVRLPEDVFNRLIEVMTCDEAYEPVEFVKTFLNARNVSSETADSVLVNILANVEPRIKPEDAITKLKQHVTMVMYVLIGKKVSQSDAITVGDSLEKSKNTVTAVKAMVGKGMKLKEEKLRAIGFKAEPIMEIISRELDPCIAFARASVTTRLRNDGANRQHCILAFITFEDLKKEHGIDALTVPLEKNKDTPTFLFVVDHDADSSHVTELFTVADVHCGALKKPVQCVEHKKGGETINLVNCIIIGGISGKGWSTQELRAELTKYDCKSSVENHIMRKIMFNAYKATDKITKKNCVNSIFIHSPKSQAIMRIVANMAPYSVVTSAAGNDLEQFKTDLWNLQSSVVKIGKTFPAKQSKAKKGEEDDDDDGGDVTYDGNGEDSIETVAAGEEEGADVQDKPEIEGAEMVPDAEAENDMAMERGDQEEEE